MCEENNVLERGMREVEIGESMHDWWNGRVEVVGKWGNEGNIPLLIRCDVRGFPVGNIKDEGKDNSLKGNIGINMQIGN